jgi:hypothetical protein
MVLYTLTTSPFNDPPPPLPCQIRALTRGQESMDEEESAETVKLLSDLSVSIPDLIDLMEGVSLWQVEVLIQDSLRKLVSGAVYTFVSMVEVRAVTPALPPPPPSLPPSLLTHPQFSRTCTYTDMGTHAEHAGCARQQRIPSPLAHMSASV